MANRSYLVILILQTIPLRGHGPLENTEEVRSRPNILCLTLEDTSEYRLGCYGNTDIKTPDNIFYPQYLREAGYFWTNNTKTDYNTTINDNSLWDVKEKGLRVNQNPRKFRYPSSGSDHL